MFSPADLIHLSAASRGVGDMRLLLAHLDERLRKVEHALVVRTKRLLDAPRTFTLVTVAVLTWVTVASILRRDSPPQFPTLLVLINIPQLSLLTALQTCAARAQEEARKQADELSRQIEQIAEAAAQLKEQMDQRDAALNELVAQLLNHPMPGIGSSDGEH